MVHMRVNLLEIFFYDLEVSITNDFTAGIFIMVDSAS